jgi:hypothetical protein
VLAFAIAAEIGQIERFGAPRSSPARPKGLPRQSRLSALSARAILGLWTRRWRRLAGAFAGKRILFTIVGIWLALCLMWFVIDLLDDSSSWLAPARDTARAMSQEV